MRSKRLSLLLVPLIWAIFSLSDSAAESTQVPASRPVKLGDAFFMSKDPESQPIPTTTTTTALPPPPSIPVNWARWERLHNCEQGNTWYANGHNKADPAHQTFQGGLGMSTKAWQMAVGAAKRRGVSLPSSALSASPQEQMTGAQAFYDAFGWGWACRV